MTTAVRDEIIPSRPRPVAPVWHTTVLIAFCLALSAAGALFQRTRGASGATPTARPALAPLYLSLIAGEWGLFLYVARGGLRRTGTRARELIGGHWRSRGEFLRDLGLGLALWGSWILVGVTWTRVLGPSHAAAVPQLLPRGGLEVPLWVALSASAGICEEFVFRGYFQRQFQALTGSRWLSVIAQGALFGISHAYQGAAACARITVYGMMFGLVAAWRGSLRPGMIAHAWTDVAAGLFGI